MLYVICQSFLHDSTVVVPGKISLKSHVVMDQQQDANNKKVVFSVFRSKANQASMFQYARLKKEYTLDLPALDKRLLINAMMKSSAGWVKCKPCMIENFPSHVNLSKSKKQGNLA
jgi:copper oxidase (laccase) domain-containing protein